LISIFLGFLAILYEPNCILDFYLPKNCQIDPNSPKFGLNHLDFLAKSSRFKKIDIDFWPNHLEEASLPSAAYIQSVRLG